MEYAEALKKVQSQKANDNFLLITTGWDLKLILPYKDGMTFINSLQNAKEYIQEYSKPSVIKELDRAKLSFCPFSYQEFLDTQVASLLNITVDAVKELRKNQTN